MMEVQGGDDTADKPRKREKKCVGCSSAIAGVSTKCKAPYCQKHYCGNVACVKMLEAHEPMCQEQARVAKEKKAAAKKAAEASGSTKKDVKP